MFTNVLHLSLMCFIGLIYCAMKPYHKIQHGPFSCKKKRNLKSGTALALMHLPRLQQY